MTDQVHISLADVYAARRRIAPYIRRTPVVRSAALSEIGGSNVYLKLETDQVSRSFKVRGAANSILQLPKEDRRRGVVTVSTGNHGKAVATIAAQLGIRAVVCVPESVLHHKVDAMRELGADVVISGEDQVQAELHAAQLADSQGLSYVAPFDDPAIIAGQGTIGLELLEEIPELSTVVVPLSGGGLMSGIAVALKHINRAVRTVGVSMDRSPVMYWSLQSGHPVELPELPTLADSLVGGFGSQNRYTFDLVRRYVDETVLVSEEEIAAAMVYALEVERIVVEGGAAVGLAAIRSGKAPIQGEHTVVVVSGGNADMDVLRSLSADRGSPVQPEAPR